MSPHRASAPFTDDWKHFRFDIEDGVATVTFDRPERLNALTFESYADFRDLLAELPHRDDIRVLVVTGSGQAFCAGGDREDIIGSLQEAGSKELLEFTRMTGAVVQRMRELPQPIVAAVNGVAAGAGAVIALAADLRVLARSATFAFLFSRVGLAGADMGSAYLLPRVVGLGRAAELLLLGEDISAERALDIGLATAVVEDAELSQHTGMLARRLVAGPSFAHAATKLLLAREQDMPLAGALELEAVTQALLMASDDHREFYRAFTEGRDPTWRGR